MTALQKLAARYPRKRVLITGATSGLGEVLSLAFAGAGFSGNLSQGHSLHVPPQALGIQ